MAAISPTKFLNCILAESLKGRGGKANRKQAKRKCGNCTPFVNVFLLRLWAFEWLKSFHQLIDWDWISCWFSCSAGRQRRFCLQTAASELQRPDKHFSRHGNADGELLNKSLQQPLRCAIFWTRCEDGSVYVCYSHLRAPMWSVCVFFF